VRAAVADLNIFTINVPLETLKGINENIQLRDRSMGFNNIEYENAHKP